MFGPVQVILQDAALLLWFLPRVLEAVLEAVRQKTNAVPNLNRSPLNIGYNFYFYDRFNAPKLSDKM